MSYHRDHHQPADAPALARSGLASPKEAAVALVRAVSTRVRDVARLLLVPAVALVMLAIAQPASAAPGDPALSNVARTSSGATLESYGYCGGSTFNYTVSAGGFEYLRIDYLTAVGMTYGEWTQVSLDAGFKVQLPYYVQNTAYVIEGADWNSTSQGWDTAFVVTSFTQVPALDYTTWFC